MIDENIPGFCPRPQLLAIQRISEAIPENGIVVEVGSLFGRSAYVWASSCKPSVRIFCIDPWDNSEFDAHIGVSSARGKYLGKKINSIETFNNYIGDRVSNIEKIQDRSPPSKWEHGLAHVVYLDGDHQFEAVTKDIEFWFLHLRADGILCGDDYNSVHPGVVKAVEDFAEKQNKKIFRIEKFWAVVSEHNSKTLKDAETVFYTEWRKILGI